MPISCRLTPAASSSRSNRDLDDWEKNVGCTREEWAALPSWKQRQLSADATLSIGTSAMQARGKKLWLQGLHPKYVIALNTQPRERTAPSAKW